MNSQWKENLLQQLDAGNGCKRNRYQRKANSPPLISSDTLKELGMLQIREDGSFGQPNSMRIQNETSSANRRPCSEDTSTRNVNMGAEDMVTEADMHEKEAYQTGRGTRTTGSSKQQLKDHSEKQQKTVMYMYAQQEEEVQ